MSHPAAPRRNATLPSVSPVIANRWSPRGFDPNHELDDDSLMTLLDAARWAPSEFNRQPWAFVTSRRGTDAFDRILDALIPYNQTWAKHASALLVGVAERERDGEPLHYAEHDLGQACAFLVLQTVTMGMDAHQMSGADFSAIAQVFGIEPPFEPRVVIAIGKHDASTAVAAELRLRDQAPRERKPLDEMVFVSL